MTPVKKKKAKVLYVGPDIRGAGGISSVLQTYSHALGAFAYLPTNSRHGNPAGALKLLCTLAQLPLRRLQGYNVLHAHGASGKSFIRKTIVMRWAKLFGYRTVFHCHGGAFADYCREAGEDVVARKLAKCSGVAVLTDWWADYFATVLHCPRVEVVPNIIELPAEPVTRCLRQASKPLRLLFMGKICHDKGIFDLLDALGSRRKEFEGRVLLTIGGDGETDAMRRRIDELGIDNMVRYAGWIGAYEKDAALRTADVLVLPSYIEGVPISLLEAGAYALPSLATRVGGIPSLIKHGVNGTLVAAGDVSALAEAIATYVADPQLCFAQGEAAARMVVPYLPEAVAQKLAKLHRSIL